MDNYVSGEKIAALADIQWSPGDILPNRDAVVYASTDDWKGIFHAISVNAQCNYILITHNSDVNVTEDIYRELPPNVIIWFSQNVCCDKSNLIPIPIGIANSKWPHGNLHDLGRSMRGIKSCECSLRCKMETNLPQRTRWANHLMKLPRTFVTGHHMLSREIYFAEIIASKYVACPPGNGVDTHRLWEVLHAGSVPIVQWYPGIDIMGVPCLMVDKPEDITEEMLEQNYTDLKYRVECEINQSSIAFMPYWENCVQAARTALFRYRLERASEIVSKWPAWKSKILDNNL